MKKFESVIEFDRDLLRKLYKANHYMYNKKYIATCILIGVALVFVAIFLNSSVIFKGILVMLGGLIIMAKDMPFYYRADEVFDTRVGKKDIIRTSLYEGGIQILGENGGNLEYDEIEAVSEKKEYFFLFLGRDRVLMLAKKDIGDSLKFKEFIEYKTGKKLREAKSILSVSLRDIIIPFKK